VYKLPAPLDPLIEGRWYELTAADVDAILAVHGPARPGEATCRGCGHVYTPAEPDCPSAVCAHAWLFVLAAGDQAAHAGRLAAV
jgi:hypothetical protein